MINENFLCILKSALEGNTSEKITLTKDDAEEVLRLASLHKLLPLVYDYIHTSCCCEETEFHPELHSAVKLTVSQQALRTEAFTSVYQQLTDMDLTPIVIKGVVCRNLYPKPDFRTSSDEDLLIPRERYNDYKNALISLGFSPIKEDPDSYQTAFARPDGFYVELHTSLFATSQFLNKWNALFSDALSRATTVKINNTEIRTLSITDHLLYLFLHALKHFIHSGVGIRQICDITMYIRTHADAVDWDYIFSICESLGVNKFVCGILAISKHRLGACELDRHISCKVSLPDETSLLEDIMCAGIYGDSSMSRKHSGAITYHAVKNGKKQSLLKRLFPSAKTLNHKYSYARSSPVLLPVAWGHRILNYRKETKNTRFNTPAEAIKTGNMRIRLLTEYRLIPESENNK